MRRCARVAAAGVLVLAGAGCVEDGTGGAGGTGDAVGGGQLEVSGSVSARLERRLSASGALPDSVFRRFYFVHMDVRSDGFSVVGGHPGSAIVGGLDLEVAQVGGLVQRDEARQGPPRGPVHPGASRVHGGRLLVMAKAWGGSVWAYPVASGDGGGFGGVGELIVDADRRTGPGGFRMGTDFAVRADGSIVVPMYEGPTYLGVVWPPRDSVAAGPAWDTRAGAGEFGHMFRYSNRVTGIENGGLLVWDDHSAVVIAAAADGTESRWSLPEEYRRTGPPEMRPSYGSSVAVDLGRPTMQGWSAVDGSVCMAVRPVDDVHGEVDLLWLDLGGAGEAPELRRIDADLPRGVDPAVSCGIVGEVLLVATPQDVLRYRLRADAESPG